MEDSKACDAYGLSAGNNVEQADAEQAYIQSKLGSDTPTWIRMPPERRPKAWEHYRDPVCPLVLALYGHPDAGGYWEKHCHDHLVSVGFETTPDWRSCYFHPAMKLFLTVYVDDFKLAGPARLLARGWSLIREHVRVEPPTPLGKYLGCNHIHHDGVFDCARHPMHNALQWPPPGTSAPGSPRGVCRRSAKG